MESFVQTNGTNLSGLKQRKEEWPKIHTENNNFKSLFLEVILEVIELWGALSFPRIASTFYLRFC